MLCNEVILICRTNNNFCPKKKNKPLIKKKKNQSFFLTEKHQTSPISLLLSSQEEAGEVRHKQFLHVPVTDRFATLSSNVFTSCTIQNNCGNFFNLDSRLAKAGRRLGPVYI